MKVYLVEKGEKFEGSTIRCATLDLVKAKRVFTTLRKELKKTWPNHKEKPFTGIEAVSYVERACDYAIIREMELK